MGDGLIFAHIKQLVQQYNLEKYVQLVGRVPHFEIPDWIGAFDVCIAPFSRERNEEIGLSPLKLYEYMACARPVVATALPGITETIEASQCGLVYPVGDTDTLQEHLHTLYKHADLRISMGERGRDYAVKHHSWDSVAKRTEQLMLHLVSGQEYCQH